MTPVISSSVKRLVLGLLQDRGMSLSRLFRFLRPHTNNDEKEMALVKREILLHHRLSYLQDPCLTSSRQGSANAFVAPLQGVYGDLQRRLCRDDRNKKGDVLLLILVTPFAEGGDFGKYLARRKQLGDPLTEEEVAQFTAMMLRTVVFLHQYGVAHRDIKPENWLVFGSSTKSDEVIEREQKI